MPADRIKVLPNVPSAVGMKHPFDCKLEESGSEWPLDSFTCRRLADASIRRAEVEAEPPKTSVEAATPPAAVAPEPPVAPDTQASSTTAA